MSLFTTKSAPKSSVSLHWYWCVSLSLCHGLKWRWLGKLYCTLIQDGLLMASSNVVGPWVKVWVLQGGESPLINWCKMSLIYQHVIPIHSFCWLIVWQFHKMLGHCLSIVTLLPSLYHLVCTFSETVWRCGLILQYYGWQSLNLCSGCTFKTKLQGSRP